ncbi:MAG: endonuclease NucS domain-containing protein, partial [candidate division WOR-3 bacterium]
MGTEIRTWQIIDGKRLVRVDSSLRDAGRTEPYDLEEWLASTPEVIGPDIAIIGRQVVTESGFIDLLGVDRSGNTVIIELKRSQLPRECLAQAIDYASVVAGWTVDRLAEECSKYTKKNLQDLFAA